jgi:hypothetical protein
MRLFPSILCLATVCVSCAAFAAQTPATPPAPAQAQMQTPGNPSATLQPALDELQHALTALRPDKWKTSDEVRRETAANISSIRNDLETTLPPLLTAADGAPVSVARALPAFRNIEALYDVLLRVTGVANLSAPSQQSMALEQARASLEDGRRTFGDRLQSAALAQDQQLHSLEATVRAAPPAPASPPACPPPPSAKKRRTHRKPATKPVPAAANSKSGVTASH